MKRSTIALFGLLTACSGGGTVAGLQATDAAASDASRDAAVEAGGPCADAGVPPSTLSCTGLYSDLATKTLAPNAQAYAPASPLWSDGAQKSRWIELPTGKVIDDSNPNEWMFPVGTKVFKEFRVDGKRVETRLFQKTTSTFWVYATYAWNADDSEATVNFGGPVPVGGDGSTWNIPTNDDCDECHRGRQDRILGFESVGLGLPGAQGLTLSELSEQNLLSPPPTSTSLTIGDDGTGLDSLAMAWIHVNCGITCHNSNPAAAGYGAGMLLRLDPTQLDGSPPSATTWDILHTTLEVPCVSGSVAGEPRISPHNPKASVLYQLIDERGALQMPPIASLVVDTTDVAVISAWIAAMNDGDAGPAPHPEGGLADAAEPADAGMDAEHPSDSSPGDARVNDASSEDSALDGGLVDSSAD